jgi:RND family efflux transporter MFP subunit
MKSLLPAFVLAGMMSLPLHAADLPAEDVVMTPAQQQTLGITTLAPETVSTVAGQELPALVTVAPDQVHLIAAPQAGLLEYMPSAVGDEVMEDQVIARLKSPELVSLQRDFLQTLSQQRLAQTAMTRDEMLFKEGVIARRRYLETQSAFEEMNAALEERRQALLLAGMAARDIAALQQNRRLTTTLQVRAPITGVVIERLAEPGQRLTMSDPIYRLANLDPLWLEIRVPLEQLPSLAAGAEVKVAGLGAAGHLLSVGRDVDAASQTVRVRAELTSGSGALRPGQYVQASIAGVAGTDRYQLPAAAVVRSGQHSIVFVQTATGFSPRIVEVLGTQDGKTVFVARFAPQERVAVTGLAAVKGAAMGLGGGE